MDKQSKSFKRKADPEQISRDTFIQCKDNLPTSLKGFVTDFQTWSKQDKEKISIFGSSFLIKGLSEEKEKEYENNLGNWIDSRTQKQNQRDNLIICLQYLKQQQK